MLQLSWRAIFYFMLLNLTYSGPGKGPSRHFRPQTEKKIRKKYSSIISNIYLKVSPKSPKSHELARTPLYKLLKSKAISLSLDSRLSTFLRSTLLPGIKRWTKNNPHIKLPHRPDVHWAIWIFLKMHKYA